MDIFDAPCLFLIGFNGSAFVDLTLNPALILRLGGSAVVY